MTVKTRRVSRPEFLEIRDEVIDALEIAVNSVLNGSTRINSLLAYRSKETFGDLDVLVESRAGSSIIWKDLLSRTFAPTEIVQNSNVYSFDYKQFQIDIILCNSDDYESSFNYFSWNDLGNLMGRVYKKMGFKYGHKGLSYMFRTKDNSQSVFAEVVVSQDISAILEFGGYDSTTFARGFNTLEDVFKFAASSEYFHKDIFLLYNRNNASRTRDRKRKTYHDFLLWCETAQDLPAYGWTTFKETDGYLGDPEFLRRALNTFPGFMEKQAQVLFLKDQRDRVHEKFNGGIISNLTGLVGRELGAFMGALIQQGGGKQKLWPWIYHAVDKELTDFIMSFYEQYKHTEKWIDTNAAIINMKENEEFYEKVRADIT